jgi:hypothetical protein
MKIRNGFVSNSSSSSFIIRLDENFPDTLSIAKSMIKNKYEEHADYDDNSDDKDWWKPSMKNAFKNLKRLKKEDDPYIPIFFTSCNYDTYIIPLTNNYVFVETCNNTRWDIEESSNVVRGGIPDEVLEKYPGSENSNGEFYITDETDDNKYKNIIYDHPFYLIENGIELTKPSEYKTCKKCYNDMWVYGDREICIKCDYEIIMRGKKIKNILDGFI